MTFEKWLETRGYFPIGVIITNYRDSGFSDVEIEGVIEEIKNIYVHWCSDNRVEPSFN